MRRTVGMLAIFLGCAFLGMADESAMTITCPGEATVTAPPSSMLFYMKYASEADTFEAAARTMKAFQERLEALLAEYELRPAKMTLLSPNVPDVNTVSFQETVQLLFSIPAMSDKEERMLRFAQHCDKMRQLANALPCELVGPELKVEDEEALMRAAVTAAAEQAYPAGEAMANATRSIISSVEAVHVDSISTNSATSPISERSNLAQVSCTAKVRIVYTTLPAN